MERKHLEEKEHDYRKKQMTQRHTPYTKITAQMSPCTHTYTSIKCFKPSFLKSFFKVTVTFLSCAICCFKSPHFSLTSSPLSTFPNDTLTVYATVCVCVSLSLGYPEVSRVYCSASDKRHSVMTQGCRATNPV